MDLLVWTPIPRAEGGGMRIEGEDARTVPLRDGTDRWSWEGGGKRGVAANGAAGMLAAQQAVYALRELAELPPVGAA